LLPVFPPGSLASATQASLATDLTFVAFFLVAEILVVFSTWAWTALDQFSRSRLLELAAEGGRTEAVVPRLARIGAYEVSARVARFLGNAVLVAGIAFLTLHDYIDGGRASGAFPWGPLGWTLAITFLLAFVVNDLLVRLAAHRKPEEFLLAALPYLDALAIAMAPIRLPLSLLVRLVFRIRLEDPGPSAREEVLESVEEGEREGSLTAHEADMIESIIDLGDLTVDDVLTPRGEIAMIQADSTLIDAVRETLEHGHQRMPVYGSDRDDVVGVLHAFDLLREISQPRPRQYARELMRSPFFVPEAKKLNDLLVEMRTRRASMALVMNEFGGTAGLVTIADVLGEIVGEFEDEHDDDEPPPEPAQDGSLLVEGRTPIEELNERFDWSLPDEEDFETIGGLVFHELGKVPQVGEKVQVGELVLEVTVADERTVKQVRIRGPRAATP
jgi:CBS domain containing-hemolysin-like protein